MEEIVNSYYADGAQKLHNMVDKILFVLGFAGFVDYEDFYSLANEIFVDAMKRYDRSQSFDSYLYSCLSNRFKSEMTRRNRYKRQADSMSVSIHTLIGDDEESTLEDVITTGLSVEEEIFRDKEEGFSKRMLLYLNRLSNLQKEVLRLTVAGYVPNEIKEDLQISEKQYTDCKAAIHSYRNVSVLF